MPAPRLPKLLTVRQVADLLELSTEAIYQRICRGEIPGVVRFGRTVRLRQSAIARWIEDGSEAA